MPITGFVTPAKHAGNQAELVGLAAHIPPRVPRMPTNGLRSFPDAHSPCAELCSPVMLASARARCQCPASRIQWADRGVALARWRHATGVDGATLPQAQPWIEAFAQRLERMIALIEERFPGGCHVFLGDIYDPSDGLGDAANAGLPPWPDGLKILRAYNQIIHACAARHPHVHVVPIHDAFLGHGIHCRQFWRRHYRPEDPTYWYGTNLEDPNDRGYDAIRRLFLVKIAEAAEAMFGLSASPGTLQQQRQP